MATTLEASSSTRSIPAIRNAEEVIDVDAFDERASQRRRLNPSQSGSNHEDVIVIESDDEEVLFVPNPRRHLHGGRLASLPPPPQDRTVPPLPPRPYIRMPLPDHIRPNPEPFAFENDLWVAPPPRPEPAASPPPPAAAPRSHHQPPMGFGGALLSTNRPTAQGHLARIFGIIRMPRFLGFGVDDAEGEEERDVDAVTFGLIPPESRFQMRPRRPAAPDYLPSYTHSDKPPLPGFSYDFETVELPAAATVEDPIVIEEDGVKAPAVNSMLICARCGDPLFLSAEMTDEQEAKKRRLWSLRCGHVLDGKCFSEIMRPSLIPLDEESSSDKGKEVEKPDETGSRMRLRSGTKKGAPVSRKRGRGKTKAKTAPTIEARHEWTCPVLGCCHPHTSIKLEGEWVPDKEKGAIGIFV